jgi:peptidoglycan hydrolase-like protein with peptidoglycan-binding domain
MEQTPAELRVKGKAIVRSIERISTTVRDRTVNAVQGELAQLGFYQGPIDGIYGRLTRDAVAKYQIARKLDVSGNLSAQTLQSLGLPRTTPS